MVSQHCNVQINKYITLWYRLTMTALFYNGDSILAQQVIDDRDTRCMTLSSDRFFGHASCQYDCTINMPRHVDMKNQTWSCIDTLPLYQLMHHPKQILYHSFPFLCAKKFSTPTIHKYKDVVIECLHWLLACSKAQVIVSTMMLNLLYNHENESCSSCSFTTSFLLVECQWYQLDRWNVQEECNKQKETRNRRDSWCG